MCERYKKIVCIIFINLSVISGCVSFQNLTVKDLKKPENLRREKKFNLTIAQIQKAIFDYSKKCIQLKNILVDPQNPKFGIIAIDSMGLTQSNVGTLMEFKETPIGTEAIGYSYYEGWAGIQIDRTFMAIENPTNCQ